MSPPLVKRVTEAGADVFSIHLGEDHSVFRARAEFQPAVAIENLGSLEAATISEVRTKTVGFVTHIVDAFVPLAP